MSFIKLLKNKPSGKLILALTLVLTFVSGLTIGSKASNHTWLSAGNVSYNNGTKTTVFDKQDLVYLDERIDSVEQNVDSYKTEIANNVNDWSIPQDKQLSSTSSFSDIADTLNYIKSTPDEGSSWVNEGNPVYKRADGSITYDASEAESGSDQLVLSAATSDNLSAGKVAWVNGDLVIGTGEDNKAYYDFGHDSVRTNLESKNLNFSGTVRTAGDTSYSNSFPETFNGKMFLCMYFTANFYCNSGLNNGGSWSESYRPTVSLDLANRRVKMFTSVEHSEIVYISGTATALYY